MGKDDGASRADLKQEHVRLVAREQEIKDQYQNAKTTFLKLEEAYQVSKGTFSVQRYGQLKEMIKSVTREDVIKGYKKVLASGQPATGAATERAGLASLVQRAKEFSGDSPVQGSDSDQQKTSSGAKPAKSGSSFFKKLKNMTGFSEDPISDEDVMSKGELDRDNSRRQRSIQRYSTQLSRAIAKLEKLQRSYESSKAHAPPKRYVELKEMIKEAVAEKLP